MSYYQVAILIPAFNPDEKLLSLLEELRPIFKYIVIFQNIIPHNNNFVNTNYYIFSINASINPKGFDKKIL